MSAEKCVREALKRFNNLGFVAPEIREERMDYIKECLENALALMPVRTAISEYQAEAMRTAPREPGKEVSRETDLAIWALGIAGEAGEVADLVKKHVGHGHAFDRAKFVKELGDVLWYLAVLANAAGATLDEVADENVRKLRARYPNGFRQADSIKRKDEVAI